MITIRRTRYLLAVLAVAAPVLGTLVVAPSATAAQPSPPENITVPIRDFAFQPADLTVHTGDTVTWVNEDEAPHDATTTSAPESFGSGTLPPGASYSYTFTTPGTYTYVCTIHPDMVAAVVAMEHAAAPPAAVPPPTAPGPDPAAAAAPGAPMGTAPPAPLPAPAAAPPAGAPPNAGSGPVQAATQPAPATTQPVGAARGRTIDPLLIVTAIALGVATLCLLLVVAPPARN